MDDLIRRQDAINLHCDLCDYSGTCVCDSCSDVEEFRQLSTSEPTLYGYKIEHLAYIATVMEKEGITAEYAVRTFDDMERVIKMIIEEVHEKIEESFNG